MSPNKSATVRKTTHPLIIGVKFLKLRIENSAAGVVYIQNIFNEPIQG